MPLADGTRLTSRFEIVRHLGEGGMGVVYEAWDTDRAARVALKTLPGLHPAALYRFKQEFRALAAISHPNLVQLYELVAEGSSWFFTMELVEGAVDFLEWVRPKGESLDAEISDVRRRASSSAGAATAVQLEARLPELEPQVQAEATTTRGRAPDLDRLRRAFVGLVDGVAAIHAAGKLHRDLKPANVLVRADGRVQILDFGLVAELARPPEDPVQSAAPARSARTTDYGISGTAAYMAPEQALGAPLDVSADLYAIGAMLFHALTGSLPFDGALNDVLFRKQVEDPPLASALADGVPEDLDRLAAALLSRDRGARPTLAETRAVLAGAEGAAPAPESVEPAAFVGRDASWQALEDALAAARAGATIVCRVSGPSGAGKSTLLDRFVDAHGDGVTTLRGRCLERESVPFKALDGVVDALTHALLVLAPGDRDAVVPDDLASLSRLFPVVGRLVDATVDAADAATLRGRACHALASVLEALGARGGVVVFVDDLQWSDVDGAELLAQLITELSRRRARVLFALGHRSEYERRSPGLAALDSALARDTPKLDSRGISLGPLSEPEAATVARALLGDAGTGAEAAWIARASEGLPWFVHELSRAVRDGVVEVGASTSGVMERRASSLPAASRRILELIAVAGTPLRLRQVKEALDEHSVPEEALLPLRAGSWIRGTGPRLDDTVESFHDRVREGVAASLSGERRRALHAALASALRTDGPSEVVAGHHEAAGDLARAAEGYERAADEARAVLALARAERLYRRAEALFADEHARARVVGKRIHHLTDTARFAEAYALGRAEVARFGVALPVAWSPPRLLAGLARVLWRMGRRTCDDLLALPVMTEPRALSAMRLLGATMKAAYQVAPELCVTVANDSVDLCLQHGNATEVSLGYMVHGTIFRGGVLGRHATGHEFGKLARALVERFDDEPRRAEVCFVVGYFGTSWLEPATAAEALWETAYAEGLRTGDLFHTGCAAAATTASLLMRGAPLGRIITSADDYLAVLTPRGLGEAAATVRGVRHVARTLATGASLDDGFDLAAHEATLSGFGSKHFALVWHVARAIAELTRGDHDSALRTLAAGAPLHGSARGMLHGVEVDYLTALASAWSARGAPAGRRAVTGARVAATAVRFTRLGADCAQNFSAKAALLAAEAKRLVQGAQASRAAFADAAELARRHGMPHVEALALRGAGDREGEAAALARWGAAPVAR